MAPRVSPTEREGSASRSSMVTGVTAVCGIGIRGYLSVFSQSFLIRDLVVFRRIPLQTVGPPAELTSVGSLWLAMDAWAAVIEKCRFELV